MNADAQDSHDLAGRLDKKALEAAVDVWLNFVPSDKVCETEEEAIRHAARENCEAVVRAYLAASPPAPSSGTLEALRYCDYCKSWNSKPCGNGCVWRPDMPTALPEPSLAQPAEAERAVKPFGWGWQTKGPGRYGRMMNYFTPSEDQAKDLVENGVEVFPLYTHPLPQAGADSELVERPEWLIRKSGYFYRPNRSGYTMEKVAAGRYTKTEADREASIEPENFTVLHESEVPDAPEVEQLKAEVSQLHTRLATVERDLEAARHEASCCDDIPLNQPLAGVISDLQTDREYLRKEKAAADAECVASMKTIAEERAAREAAEAKLAEAREVIEPFAGFAKDVAEHHSGWDHDGFLFEMAGYTTSLLPFRRARSFLSSIAEKTTPATDREGR